MHHQTVSVVAAFLLSCFPCDVVSQPYVEIGDVLSNNDFDFQMDNEFNLAVESLNLEAALSVENASLLTIGDISIAPSGASSIAYNAVGAISQMNFQSHVKQELKFIREKLVIMDQKLDFIIGALDRIDKRLIAISDKLDHITYGLNKLYENIEQVPAETVDALHAGNLSIVADRIDNWAKDSKRHSQEIAYEYYDFRRKIRALKDSRSPDYMVTIAYSAPLEVSMIFLKTRDKDDAKEEALDALQRYMEYWDGILANNNVPEGMTSLRYNDSLPDRIVISANRIQDNIPIVKAVPTGAKIKAMDDWGLPYNLNLEKDEFVFVNSDNTFAMGHVEASSANRASDWNSCSMPFRINNQFFSFSGPIKTLGALSRDEGTGEFKFHGYFVYPQKGTSVNSISVNHNNTTRFYDKFPYHRKYPFSEDRPGSARDWETHMRAQQFSTLIPPMKNQNQKKPVVCTASLEPSPNWKMPEFKRVRDQDLASLREDYDRIIDSLVLIEAARLGRSKVEKMMNDIRS